MDGGEWREREIRKMNMEPSSEVDEEVKMWKIEILVQNAKRQLMMLTDVTSGGETNEFFWAMGG